jgi:hypothetical protein
MKTGVSRSRRWPVLRTNVAVDQIGLHYIMISTAQLLSVWEKKTKCTVHRVQHPQIGCQIEIREKNILIKAHITCA